MELLAPAQPLISTLVVVGEARLQSSQCGLVLQAGGSVAKVSSWRATHVTGIITGTLRLCVCCVYVSVCVVCMCSQV